MARPGLRTHPKFKRLLALRHIPEPHLYGLLQMLWDASYEFGEDIGDAIDVEINAGWSGDPGVFCDALATCAGPGRSGFIEPNPDKPGHWRIHDLFEHAPNYVARRIAKEITRKKGRPCANCGEMFYSTEPHAKYCTNACRTSAYRVRHGDAPVTDNDVTPRHSDADVTGSDAPPSPSPSPIKETPVVPKGMRPSRAGRGKDATTGDKVQDRYILAVASGMVAGWPKQNINGEDMPHASRSALYARLVSLVLAGIQIDQLRARGNAYLDECAPMDRKTAKVGTKAPQFFFGATGPWQDYDETPPLRPLSLERVAAALGEHPPPSPIPLLHLPPTEPPSHAAATA